MVKMRKRLIDFFMSGQITEERYQKEIIADGNKPDSPFKEKTLDV